MIQLSKIFRKAEPFLAENGFSLRAVPCQQQLYTKVYLALSLSQGLQQGSGEKEETL